MINVFFGGDEHFGHRQIIRHCKRPFPNVHVMKQTIIENHNSVVNPNDKYYQLGDFAFRCRPEYVSECLQCMNGQFIMLLGNHDKPIRQAWRRGLLDDLIKSKKVTIIASHDRKVINSLDLSIHGQRLILSHYPYHSWPGAFRGTWHLHAHCHNNLKSFGKRLDIGVDGHNFFPWNFDEIEEYMNKTRQETAENEDIEGS